MRGFTLVELMAVLAITSVLAALAWPGYGRVVHRTLRQDARLALLGIQYRQELYFSQYHRYATAAAGDEQAAGIPLRSDAGHYLLETRATPGGYIAIARVDPAGRQARDARCTQLAIDQTGLRLAAARNETLRETDPDRCWG